MSDYIVGIDPGTDKSGVVITRKKGMEIIDAGVADNDSVRSILLDVRADRIVIEITEGRGMVVGQSTLDTAIWIGRFIEVFPRDAYGIYRRYVKQMLCGSVTAKDKNVRQAVIDMYPATGGGKNPVVGTSKEPGVLHGVTSHAWQALGLIHAYYLLKEENSEKLMHYPR